MPFIIDIDTTTSSFKPAIEDSATMTAIAFKRHHAAAAGNEVARILREIADRLEQAGMLDAGDKIALRDAKDNIVGSARVTSSRR